MHIPAALLFGDRNRILWWSWSDSWLLSRIAAVKIAVIMVVAIVLVHGRLGRLLNWLGDREAYGYE
jgi:hypothetical protein